MYNFFSKFLGQAEFSPWPKHPWINVYMGDTEQAAKLTKNVQHGGGGGFSKAVFWLVSQFFGYYKFIFAVFLLAVD